MTKIIHSQKAIFGTWKLTLLVAGNIIGSGIFLLPSALASYGTVGVLSWTFTAAGALSLAWVFARLSAIFPKNGGFYAYCREAFGEFVGFQVAYNYWITLWVGNTALVVALTGYLSIFFPILKEKAIFAFFINTSIIWLLTGLIYLNVRYMALLQTITTFIKLVPLLMICVLGVYFFDFRHFLTFTPSYTSHFLAFNEAATLTLWSFLGLESATLSTNHVIDPKKTIPRATLLGVSIAAILYIWGYISMIGILSFHKIMSSSAPYADAIKPILGEAASTVMAGIAALSCLSALIGWTYLQGQIPYSAAQDQLFPKLFLKTNQESVPIVGIIISSTLMTFLLLLQLNQSLVSQFTFIVLLATLASLIPYFFTVMSAFLLMIKYPKSFQDRVGLKFTIGVSVIASLYAFWMIIGAGQTIVFYGFCLLLSSMPMYIILKMNTAKEKNVTSVRRWEY